MAANLVSLQDLCLLTVRSYLSPSNVWSIHILVPYVHCPRIEHIVHSFICDNFMDISHTDQFLALDEKEMQWLLDNQDIKVSEAAMLDSLVRWYKHKGKQRENAFKQLFDKLHLSVIGKDVLSEVIKKYQLVKVIPELRKFKKLLPQRVNLDELIFQENISNIAVLEQCPFPWQLLFEKYDEIIYWMPVASKSLVVKCPVLSFLDVLDGEDVLLLEKKVPYGNNEVFIMGLAQSHSEVFSPISFNLKFNYISQTLKICTPFPNSDALKHYISVLCGDFIFFIGGQNTFTGTCSASKVFRYDIFNDHWQEAQQTIMTYSSQTDCAVSFKNRYVYIFGKNSSEIYDLATNSWTSLTIPWQWEKENIDRLQANALGGCSICVWLKIRSRFVYHLFAYDPTTQIWESHGEKYQRDAPVTFFGSIFLLHYSRASSVRFTNDRMPKMYLSIVNNSLAVQKRLVSIKKHWHFNKDCFHLNVISRGARLSIEKELNLLLLSTI